MCTRSEVSTPKDEGDGEGKVAFPEMIKPHVPS